MVVMWPEKRWSAEACHARAELLSVPMLSHHEMPTPALSSVRSKLLTIRCQPDRSMIKDPQDVTRPLAPLPPGISVPVSRKRLTTVSVSSSPSLRQNKRRDNGSNVAQSTVGQVTSRMRVLLCQTEAEGRMCIIHDASKQSLAGEDEKRMNTT